MIFFVIGICLILLSVYLIISLDQYLIGPLTFAIGVAFMIGDVITNVSTPEEEPDKKIEIAEVTSDKKKRQTSSECEVDEFCKVKRIQVNLLCNSTGCWIDNNSIIEEAGW